MKKLVIFLIAFLPFISIAEKPDTSKYKSFSGIFPHLAYYNNEGECGTGAVIPWADRLWVITYGPHLPFGSSDKLYEITPGLQKTVRSESQGGTHANRMIHRESNQLFIGPYSIDATGNVRTIPSSKMPGRLTGNARHLTDPIGKIYYGTMEEGFYEADVKTLGIKMLYPDGNVIRKPGEMAQENELLPGAHGKGMYSGQGVLVYSNNGEATEEALRRFDVKSGVLAEWDGKTWKVIRRNQFCEVTGPGGIYGNSNPDKDPIWVNGWDHKSLIVGVRDNGRWSFYRLPKASHSYDGAHGWNTEWPRIRDIGTKEKPNYLMTMHGMFWRFPGTFSSFNSAGIRPRSAYLKVIGDFAEWNGQLVFGCDDSAQKEFLNKRKVKGSIEGPGQSNSNLWFTSPEKPDQLGPATAEGAVWLSEEIPAGEFSEPFLFAGWNFRSAWIKNEGEQPVTFTFEVDKKGNNHWEYLKKMEVNPNQSICIPFEKSDIGEWIKVKTDITTKATVHFSYTQRDQRTKTPEMIFSGLSKITDPESNAGLLWGLGNNKRRLGVLAGKVSDKEFTESGYYELDSTMNLVRTNEPETVAQIREKMAIPKHVISMDEASVLVVDEAGRRWRLPKSHSRFEQLTNQGLMRICREVATERDLFNCAGTFYELPAENADGFAKIRPVASHPFRIYDYASWRGMLVMTGIDVHTKGNPNIVISEDGKAAVWAGVIDDLWKLGKPIGTGGPWKNTKVNAGEPSDPYLIGFYDRKTLQLSHNLKESVKFTIQIDPIGEGSWMNFKELIVAPGKTLKYSFPEYFQGRWIRFIANKACISTAWLIYN